MVSGGVSRTLRTDNWVVETTNEQRKMVAATIELYRQYVRALVPLVWIHWAEIEAAGRDVKAIERLMHPTSKRPTVRYRYFQRRFYKFPSYLRRAAIMAAIGQVSSFIARYDRWQAGERKRPDARPPRRTCENHLNPALYRGSMIRFYPGDDAVRIKLWNGTDWIWSRFTIKDKGKKRHQPTHKRPGGLAVNLALSPTLRRKGSKILLSAPYQIPDYCWTDRQPVVCAVDLGMNTTAVASIVAQDGTVLARRFFHRGSDIDRRDKLLTQIRVKASKTGKLSKGFCRSLYRRAVHLNEEMARRIARGVLTFAEAHKASCIVIENLGGWRPRGGKRRSTLRQRFHGWLHRKLALQLEAIAGERRIKVQSVSPYRTSKLAFDGSGKVERDKENAALATFPNGKQYNADLNASYNIAARYWVEQLGRKEAGLRAAGHGNSTEAHTGRSSRRAPRMPVTLSTLWIGAEERETPSTAAAAA